MRIRSRLWKVVVWGTLLILASLAGALCLGRLGFSPRR